MPGMVRSVGWDEDARFLLTREGGERIVISVRRSMRRSGIEVGIEAPRSVLIRRDDGTRPGEPTGRPSRWPRLAAAIALGRIVRALGTVEGRSARDWSTIESARDDLRRVASGLCPDAGSDGNERRVS